MRATRALAVAAVALPAALGTTAPANAATEYRTFTQNGCTVRISNVAQAIDEAEGRVRIRFRQSVTCPADRRFRYQVQAWEEDNGKPGDVGGSDQVGSTFYPYTTFQATTNPYTASWVVNRSYDEPDIWGEFFQRLRVQVKINGEAAFPWSTWRRGSSSSVRVPAQHVVPALS